MAFMQLDVELVIASPRKDVGDLEGSIFELGYFVVDNVNAGYVGHVGAFDVAGERGILVFFSSFIDYVVVCVPRLYVYSLFVSYVLFPLVIYCRIFVTDFSRNH
jgi:hypothetical protein